MAVCASSYGGDWYARNGTDYHWFDLGAPWVYFQANNMSDTSTYFDVHQSQNGHNATLGGLVAQGWAPY